jgi:alkylation response protein AidB-like acyl-CoA dehydrogenase
MEFGFTEEQENLRREIREFFMSELPEDYEHTITNPPGRETQEWMMALKDKAVKKGYYVPGWPREYGGSGFSEIEQGILDEEQGSFGIRWPDFIGLHLLGPSLMMFGTDDQKKRWIPPIARGETVCFQVFTEPDAGSDEANIRCRAEAVGDDFLFNGQKLFVSGAYKPTLLFVLARTREIEPKHKGLSLFLMPADLPGISYQPLPTMGVGLQNFVFFDNVRVPKDHLVGKLHNGFYHAMQVLEFERRMTGDAATAKSLLRELVHFCRETESGGRPLFDTSQVRERLARLAVAIEVQRLAGWHSTWAFAERERLGFVPYDVSNYYGKKYGAAHAKEMLDTLGLYGQLTVGSRWAALGGKLEKLWKVTRSLHVGGTFEVVKIVLAQRGLGLPRIPGNLMKQIGEAVTKKA